MRAAGTAGRLAGRSSLPRVLLLLCLAKAAFLVGAGLLPVAPPVTRAAPAATVFVDSRGEVLAFDQAEGLAIPVTLADVSAAAIAATIAAEDERFFEHQGVDPGAVLRAATSLAWEPSGASTITQQLARNLYLDEGEPVLLRKAREAVVATALETRFDKAEILESYLNTTYYGHGAYGIEAAARLYFGVPARDLDLARAALLAGLPQAPDALDPIRSPAGARERQRYVLHRMVLAGAATAEEAALAAERAPVLREVADRPIAPHFLAYVGDELARIRPDLARRPGLIVETTLDARLQVEAEAAVRRQLERLTGRGEPPSGMAVVVIEPATGRILAMVGSPEFESETAGQVNGAVSLRQPGSAIKPFLYATALARSYTAATPLLDIPYSVAVPEGLYTPQNFDRQYRGIVPLRVALASSLNVPAVRLLDAIGLDAFVETLAAVGLAPTSTAAHGPALALGTGEVTLLDLVAAYGSFAALGERILPVAIARVRATDGTVLYEAALPRPARVFDPGIAWLIGDMLSDPLARTPGFGRPAAFDLPFRAAVKTGTTTGFRDNWAVGYTPSRAVGVWAGNANGSEMDGTSGVEGAAPVWHDVLLTAMEGVPATWPAAPASLMRARICTPTGLLPGTACPTVSDEWFLAGTEPHAVERYYERRADGTAVIHPPAEADGWLRAAGWPLADSRGDDAWVAILSPADGAVFALAPEVGETGVLVRVAASPGVEGIRLTVDGHSLTPAGGDPMTAVWQPSVGLHVLEVSGVGPGGSVVQTSAKYEVRRP